ncbi:MAG: dihydrodipicolinate synthase family protein [Alphaproteobacteria bacterium]|nr:dihydrodipicolinate synthase family protein [Alphaproteobacteria bacterium]
MSETPRRPDGRPILCGNWATLLLPIQADDRIDFGALDAELDRIVAARVDGVYSNGTAGEFHNQTEDEFERIQAMMAAKCSAAGLPFAIGACHPDPTVSGMRVRTAARLRPAAIQVILPDWWPPTDAEVVDFLAMMAEAAGGVPLILYNPPHAKRVLAPATLGALAAAVPAVRAAKIADGDPQWYAQARRHLAGLALFLPGHHLATGMREGVAAGSFSNVACLSPAGAQRWTDSMARNPDAALLVERRLRDFMDRHIVPLQRAHGYSNGALDKLLAAIGDWAPVGTRLRRPYRWIPADEAVRLRPIARAMLPEILGDDVAARA